MKKIIVLIIFILAINSVFANIGFLQNLQTASSKNDNTLLVFYKPDCPYCINMDKAVSNDADFQKKLLEKYNVKVLDITTAEGRLMADKFNIHAVPSMVNFNNATGKSKIIKGFGGIEKLAASLNIITSTINKNNNPVNNLATCGDGIVEAGEGCDDGNLSNGDGCNATCLVEAGFNCTGSPSICTPVAVCGDGIVGAGEACDDGNNTNGDGCNSSCSIEAGFNCTGNPSICNYNDECINAVTLSGTSGTAAGQNSSATNSVGVPAPTCQTNINKDVWFTFTLSTSKICRFEVNGPSIADPVLAIYSGTCGALVQVACDDDGGPGAFSLIQTTLNAGTYYARIASFNATAAGTFSLVYNLNLSNICGNSIIESTEECDDGNTTNGDGCSSTCKTENASSIKGVGINSDSTRANPSAMLDVKSFDRGILIPRMNTGQRTAIAAPAKGLLVFDITTSTFWYYSGSVWTEVGGTAGTAGGGLPAGTASQTLRSNGTNWIANSALQNDGTNVTVSGQIKINGGVPGSGKVLTSDATGLATWKDAPGSVAFSVMLDSNRTIPHGGASVRLHFGLLAASANNYNTGNAFNQNTDEFVAPSSGLYSFTMDIYSVSLTSDYSIINEFRVNNSSNTFTTQVPFVDIVNAAGSLKGSYSHTAILNLNAGDKVFILSSKFNSANTSNVIVDSGSASAAGTRFMGYKIN